MRFRRKSRRDNTIGEVYAVLPDPDEVFTYTVEPPPPLPPSDCTGNFCNTCADGRKMLRAIDCHGAYTPAPQPVASGPGPGGSYTSGSGGIFSTTVAPAPVPIAPSNSSEVAMYDPGYQEFQTILNTAPEISETSVAAQPPEAGGLFKLLAALAFAANFL